MKKLIFAFCLMIGATAAVQAQDSTATAPSPSQQYSGQEQEGDKTPIAVADLPASITKQLQGTDYTGWTASKAWTKEKDGKTWYAVEVTKGSETKTLKFDADGNLVKEKDKKEKM